MIEIYLSVGVIISIAMLLMTHTKAYDSYCIEFEGGLDPQWRKVLFSVSLIAWWPVFVLTLFLKGKRNE
jgi:hypothetical protein